MSFMKKKSNFIVLIVICAITTLLIGLMIWQETKRQVEDELLIFVNHYTLINSDTLEVEIYANKSESRFLSFANIQSIDLFDEVTKDEFAVLLTNTVQTDQRLIKGQKYYQTKITIKLPFRSSAAIAFAKANLRFNYINGETKEFFLGSLYYQEAKFEKVFLIKKMKGVMTSIGNQLTLGGIILNLSNLEDYEIVIERLTLTNGAIQTNYDYLKEIESEAISLESPLLELTSKEYDSLKPSMRTSCEINYQASENHLLFIPITYSYQTVVGKVGLIIDYKINNESYQQVIEPILLFHNNLEEGLVYR